MQPVSTSPDGRTIRNLIDPGELVGGEGVSTSPDGRTIRNHTPRSLHHRSPRVSTSPDGRTIRNPASPPPPRCTSSCFNFPGWKNHPELRSHCSLLVRPSRVSTSPDGRTIRNLVQFVGSVARAHAFQLPRMEEPSGTPAFGTPALQGLSRRIARSPSPRPWRHPSPGAKTAQIPCAARQRAAPRNYWGFRRIRGVRAHAAASSRPAPKWRPQPTPRTGSGCSPLIAIR